MGNEYSSYGSYGANDAMANAAYQQFLQSQQAGQQAGQQVTSKQNNGNQIVDNGFSLVTPDAPTTQQVQQVQQINNPQGAYNQNYKSFANSPSIFAQNDVFASQLMASKPWEQFQVGNPEQFPQGGVPTAQVPVNPNNSNNPTSKNEQISFTI